MSRELQQPMTSGPGQQQADERGRGLEKGQLEAEQGQRGLPGLQGQQADEPREQERLERRAVFRDGGCGRSRPGTINQPIKPPGPRGRASRKTNQAPPPPDGLDVVTLASR